MAPWWISCGMTCQYPKLLHGGRPGMLGVWALVLWTQANGLSEDLWLVMNSPLLSIIAAWYLNLSMAIDFTLAQIVKSLRIGEALISSSFVWKPIKTNNQIRENFKFKLFNSSSIVKEAWVYFTWHDESCVGIHSREQGLVAFQRVRVWVWALGWVTFLVLGFRCTLPPMVRRSFSTNHMGTEGVCIWGRPACPLPFEVFTFERRQ